MRQLLFLTILCCIGIKGEAQNISHDSIINSYLKHGAWQHRYLDKEWEMCIDSGLAGDSSVAYLWQQKSMPYFKKQKYEVGLRCLNKAVECDGKWRPYRAFMLCIFVKNYEVALQEFEWCERTSNGYIMDHSYRFYKSLCYLQLNQFNEAYHFLKRINEEVLSSKGKEWQHPVEVFYLGVSYFELGRYQEAIDVFNEALRLYPNFSDCKYYKGKCLGYLGDTSAMKELETAARADYLNGYTINEDNAIYEHYPYQVNWKMKGLPY